MTLVGIVQRPAGTLLLGVNLPPLPEVIDFDGRSWAAKSEFHVTLIGNEGLRWLVRQLREKGGRVDRGDRGDRDDGVELDETLPFLDGRIVARVGEAITRAVEGITFRIMPRDEVWKLREGEARTLIRMVSVEGGEEFFARLEHDLSVWIERPPYHVTLYCSATEKGIGVRSARQLRSLGQPVSADELLKKIGERR